MKTTNYGLKSNFVTDFEENMEIIDTALKAVDDKVSQGVGQEIGVSMVRCSGYFNELTTPAASGNILTPIVTNGDTLLIQNKNFVAPVSGLYILNVSAFYTPSTANRIITWIWDQDNNRIGTTISFDQNGPSCCVVKWLNKGEWLQARDFSNTNITREKHQTFEFALIGTM